MPNICLEVVINAPIEKVYQAVTSQEGLAAWWTPAATVNGDVARFPFGPHYFKEMKIMQQLSPTFVSWHCLAGADEWVGTSISFRMDAGNGEMLLKAHPEAGGQIEQQDQPDNATVLYFEHADWKAYTPMFAECSYTWGQFLRSLKLCCETGKGRPWPEQHRVG